MTKPYEVWKRAVQNSVCVVGDENYNVVERYNFTQQHPIETIR